MSARAARNIRKVAQETAQRMAGQAEPAINAALAGARGALENEMVTRRRVDAMEAVMGRTLWGRLRWLAVGR